MATKQHWIIAVGLWLTAITVIPAQDQSKPWGFLSTNPDTKSAPNGAGPLFLRSNARQVLSLFVYNPNSDTPTVTVTVLAGNRVVATGETSFSGIELKKVVLKPAGPPAPPAGTPAATTGDAGVEIPIDPASGKFQLTIDVANKNRPEIPKNTSLQSVEIINPSTYLGETSATFIGANNQLTVNVRAGEFQGPPITVELVLNPQDVPGLQKGELKGVTRGTLTEQQKELTLYAAELALKPGSTGNGSALLTVDGIERAVILNGSFRIQSGGRSDPFRIDRNPRLHISAPEMARPGQEITAKIEAANLPDDTRLSFFLESPSGVEKVIGQTVDRTSVRDRSAAIKVLEDGVLAITTVSRPWIFKPDTRGLYGPHKFKAIATRGNELISDEATVIFDDTAPKDVRILPGDPKKPPVKGRSYIIRAVGDDSDSQIAKVEFFVGAEPPPPSPDGKEPTGPKPVIGVPGPKGPNGQTWSGKIALPEKAGPVTVFARFTNGVGMHDIAKAELNVLESSAGGVRGQVTYGQLVQKEDVNVWLTSKDRKTLIKDTKVGADGYFEFTDIPAGEYQLLAQRIISAKPLIGTVSVTVKEGPELTPATIKLSQSK